MQRIGRVNRIGSTAKFIHIFNFYPTTQVVEAKQRGFATLRNSASGCINTRDFAPRPSDGHNSKPRTKTHRDALAV
jgi:hypothetical protein